MADTVAAHSVGGFKVGVGFALDNRMTTSILFIKVFTSLCFWDRHVRHTTHEDSVTYGVNFYGTTWKPFNSFNGPQDIMHIMHISCTSGVLPYEVTCKSGKTVPVGWVLPFLLGVSPHPSSNHVAQSCEFIVWNLLIIKFLVYIQLLKCGIWQSICHCTDYWSKDQDQDLWNPHR